MTSPDTVQREEGLGRRPLDPHSPALSGIVDLEHVPWPLTKGAIPARHQLPLPLNSYSSLRIQLTLNAGSLSLLVPLYGELVLFRTLSHMMHPSVTEPFTKQDFTHSEDF